MLSASGADSTKLKLEMTESMMLKNVEDVILKMGQLKQLGLSFSLDDFGTGYSSLQYLKRLPLDQIKIDQSFVRDIATDANDEVIVHTIIAMTKALGFNVIAEGVDARAAWLPGTVRLRSSRAICSASRSRWSSSRHRCGSGMLEQILQHSAEKSKMAALAWSTCLESRHTIARYHF